MGTGSTYLGREMPALVNAVATSTMHTWSCAGCLRHAVSTSAPRSAVISALRPGLHAVRTEGVAPGVHGILCAWLPTAMSTYKTNTNTQTKYQPLYHRNTSSSGHGSGVGFKRPVHIHQALLQRDTRVTASTIHSSSILPHHIAADKLQELTKGLFAGWVGCYGVCCTILLQAVHEPIDCVACIKRCCCTSMHCGRQHEQKGDHVHFEGKSRLLVPMYITQW